MQTPLLTSVNFPSLSFGFGSLIAHLVCWILYLILGYIYYIGIFLLKFLFLRLEGIKSGLSPAAGKREKILITCGWLA